MNREELLNHVRNVSPIGAFDNRWRGRNVNIYDHPTNPNMVVTVGYPYGSSDGIVCEEERSGFVRWIGKFNGVAH